MTIPLGTFRMILPTRVDGRPEAQRPQGFWLQASHEELYGEGWQTIVDYNFYSTEKPEV